MMNNNIPSQLTNHQNNLICPGMIEKIEKSINKLAGVLFSKIILDENHQIGGIHVITRDDCNPKKIIRDVESLLIAKFNLLFDYRKISVAQVKEDGNNPNRLKFTDLFINLKKNELEIIVQLEDNDKIHEGRILCINWDNNREYLVARAALDAITAYLKGSLFFHIKEIKRIEIDIHEVFLVSICVISSKGKENLVGSAMVRDDPNKAIVCALLKAINRKIFFQ